MKTNKVQPIMITFVYIVLAIAFFYVYGFNFKRFKITGRITEIHVQKLSFISLVISAFLLVAFGLLIIYSKKRIYRRK
ncbi:MAG: hypothetical protein QMD36_04805 [Candidatus Aenigmarchaeota archaeon]|nr:hypothetical protein [Candidatus Aenigmarchaeota archaeon]